MTRRRALAVFAAAAVLLALVNGLVYSLYRAEVRAVEGGLGDRLLALGTTAARWLASGGDGEQALGALVAANRLEDAYVIDRDRRVVAGVRTRAGSSLNLLRVDADRLAAARRGAASSGHGYSIANAAVEAAYFPVPGDRVLALEAGAEYHEPAARLDAAYTIAVALTIVVAIVFAAVLVLGLRALERARVAYGRAERLAGVGQMAAMVAHEVRNPLGVLRGQVELARERLDDTAPPRERERFADMLDAIDRLNRLTEEFLGLARELPLDVAQVELGALARAVADDARVAAPAARIEVVADAPVEIAGDRSRLRQALYNLVLNAAQVGGDGVAVRVEVAHTTDRARVSVADDGPGVPAGAAATLFEPFVGSRPGGSGLGLAVARRVVERHGGTLALESRAGERGARFTISLPLRGGVS